MSFELRMNIPTAFARAEASGLQYDPELDDVGSVLHDICEAMEVAGVGFLARVCSDEHWPVTVNRDLLIVIEQLNDALTALRRGEAATLDFYEQGIERTVSFSPGNEVITIECDDMILKETSRPGVDVLPRDRVITELSRLADDFLRTSRALCPELTRHPWFEDWATQLQLASDSIQSQKSN